MTLAMLGWAVVHSWWQWTLIAGVTTMLLGLLHASRAGTRYAVALASLAVMAVTSVGTGLAADQIARHEARLQLLYAFDGALIIPAITPVGATILRVCAIAWIIGVGVGLVRATHAWHRAYLLRRRDLVTVPETVTATVSAVGAQLGVSAAVDVRRSTRATVPMVLGSRRPLILLPVAALRLSAVELRAILAHEIGHVRRHDYLTNLIQLALDTLMFHHPAARWVSRQVRIEREYCCDDLAVSVTGDAPTYARALAALEDTRTNCPLAVAAASGTLLDRIQRIVQRPRHVLTPVRSVALLFVAVVVTAALLALTVNVPGPSTPSGVRLRRPNPALLIHDVAPRSR